MHALILLAIAAVGTEPDPAIARNYAGYTLVLFVHSNKPEQLLLLPELRKAYERGYPVRFGYADRGRNPEYLAFWRLSATPLYIMSRAHRALETTSEPLDVQQIAAWFLRQQGEGDLDSQDEPRPATHQQRLAPLDRRYLRYQLSPGSCGMLGCTAHGGGARLTPW